MASVTVRIACLATALVLHTVRCEAQERPGAPAPANSFPGQLVLGGIGSFVGTLALGFVGSRLEPDCSCDDPGLMGAIVGGMAGAALGAAIPVYVVGKVGPHEGSFGATLLGGVLGMGVFLVAGPALQLDPDRAPFWVGFWGLPTLGAVAGYHAAIPSRSKQGRLRLSAAPIGPAGVGATVAATVSF